MSLCVDWTLGVGSLLHMVLGGVPRVTLFSWELSQGWNFQDGLSPMSGMVLALAGFCHSLLRGISSSLSTWPLEPVLFFPWYWLPRGQIWKLQSLFWLRPGSHPVSLLPHSISQSKSQGQLRSREGEIGSTSYWEEEWPIHIAKGHAERERLRWPSWTQSTHPARSALSVLNSQRKPKGQEEVVKTVDTEVSDRGMWGSMRAAPRPSKYCNPCCHHLINLGVATVARLYTPWHCPAGPFVSSHLGPDNLSILCVTKAINKQGDFKPRNMIFQKALKSLCWDCLY